MDRWGGAPPGLEPEAPLTISAVPVMASSGMQYIWCLVFTLQWPASPSPTFTSITRKLVPPRSSERKSPTSAATGRGGGKAGGPGVLDKGLQCQASGDTTFNRGEGVKGELGSPWEPPALN